MLKCIRKEMWNTGLKVQVVTFDSVVGFKSACFGGEVDLCGSNK